MNPEQIAELRAPAKAAASLALGAWYAPEELVAHAGLFPENAAHIAGMDPTTTLALLKDAELFVSLRAELTELADTGTLRRDAERVHAGTHPTELGHRVSALTIDVLDQIDALLAKYAPDTTTEEKP